MLGNVQFELQKLLDSYRSHVVLTITSPSESLLNELRTVEVIDKVQEESKSRTDRKPPGVGRGRGRGRGREDSTSGRPTEGIGRGRGRGGPGGRTGGSRGSARGSR